MKDKSHLLFVLLLIPVVMFFVRNSFSLPVEEEIKTVEIQSNNYPEPGSWHIDKSAEWTGPGQARVTFDVNSRLKTIDNHNKDVILVIDISGSMEEEKLDRVKEDSINLINTLLSNSNNKLALITFDTTAQIISSFSNDKDQIVNYILNLSSKDRTNYTSGLLKVEEVLNNYVKDDNRDLTVLFLTDGYPNEEVPNEKAEYIILKEKYPYMTINGIQYEMGNDIIQDIVDVSDNQFIADKTSLNNVLIRATFEPVAYENFVITDYINDNYFYINSVDDIEVPYGDVVLENENGVQKIIWNLGNNYFTSNYSKMHINLKLKEDYYETRGFYPTNNEEIILSKLPGESQIEESSELTPVLKNIYNVIYDVNPPSGCTISSIPSEEHFVYQLVTKREDNLSCTGYLFKGWQIDLDNNIDVKIINSDTFIMPNHDLIIRATWTKQDLTKKMDGEVHEKMTLYKAVENYITIDGSVKKYTGSHQDSINNSGDKDIYYWNNSSSINKSNVIFANHCWQIIRTTDTGGVKLIYNGEPDNNKCMSNRDNHIGYSSWTTLDLNGSYYYGSDYEYNQDDNTFKLKGDINVEVWSETTSGNLIGKYTCKAETQNATCTTLYLVERFDSSTNKAGVIKITNESHYSQIGVTRYNYNPISLADFGYMLNTRYGGTTKEFAPSSRFYEYYSLSSAIWYSDSYEWSTQESNKYSLVNPRQIISSDDYVNLVGKYTFFSTNEMYTYNKIHYIVGVNGSSIYYITLSSGNNLEYYNDKYIYGDNYKENADGSFTIINNNGSQPNQINRIDLYINYNELNDKYLCINSNSCNDIKHIKTTSSSSFSSVSSLSKYKFANGFSYECDNNNENCKYILDENSITIWDIIHQDNLTTLNSHHYTCLNEEGVCEKIAYIYFMSYNSEAYMIKYDGGKSIERVFSEMISLDSDDYHINKNNSIVKTAIDAWYKKYIYDEYDNFIEDTIYCNDRTISQIGGWDPNGGNIKNFLQFKEYNSSRDLSCSNETDRFSTLNNKAKLIYKVGLPSNPEMNLIGNLKQTGQVYWTNSPRYYLYYTALQNTISPGNSYVYGSHGIRPVISLIPEIEYSSGDGSMENPYIIDTTIDY